ncbi:hypothetical protein [Spirosoma arcticum]
MNISSYLRLAMIAFMLTVASIPGLAQLKNAPVLTPEGFWVVEWMPKSHQCTVRFYTSQKQLIYEETVDRPLNIARRQTKRNLNVALEQAMYVWQATHKVPTDRQWVAVQFDKK